MTWFALWLAGLAAVQVLGRWSLREEPTTHGQIAGRFVINVTSVCWPIALVYLIVVLAGMGVAKGRALAKWVWQ